MQNFFQAAPFIPHGHCYLWKPDLVGLHVFSDAVIAIAYYSIPLMLLYFIRKRRDVPFNGLFLLFSLFIISCGTTHLMEIWTLWYPNYWLAGWLKIVTAIISIYTAIELFIAFPQLLAFPITNQQLTKEIRDRKRIEEELERRVSERTAELTQINRELQDSRTRFAGILDIADDAIISIDQDQNITLFNQGAEQIFGYKSDEVMGRSLSVLLPSRFTQVHSQHVQAFGCCSEPSRRMGERRSIFGRCKDGREFPAEASISRLDLEHEQIFTVILRDVTERYEIERMKDEFVSVVSHELRTPLTAIHGSLKLFASGLLESQLEKGKRLIQIAAESTDRLVRLINDILDIERIESGKIGMVRTDCNLAELMMEAIEEVQPLATKSGITLSVSPLPIQIWADRDRIIQTLTNLLSNAIKFSSAGSTVSLKAELQRNQVLVQVCDRGRGIPADELERIFERFQQVDSSDSRHNEGTGLGLAICRSIVQQHSGRIWVESELGKGSTFFFTLPSWS